MKCYAITVVTKALEDARLYKTLHLNKLQVRETSLSACVNRESPELYLMFDHRLHESQVCFRKDIRKPYLRVMKWRRPLNQIQQLGAAMLGLPKKTLL